MEQQKPKPDELSIQLAEIFRIQIAVKEAECLGMSLEQYLNYIGIKTGSAKKPRIELS